MTKQEGTGFEKKLARYALAGGAALALPLSADASVVYSGILNQQIVADSSYNVDLDNNSVVDFTITAQGTFDPAFVAVSGPSSTQFVVSGGYPAALNFGDVISMANATGSGGDLTRVDASLGPALKTGNWLSQEVIIPGVFEPTVPSATAFLGLKFDIGGTTHLGWAQIATDIVAIQDPSFPTPAQATLINFAYETEAETQITAGAGIPAAVPEPSTLALLALGATGLLAVRRRRNSTN